MSATEELEAIKLAVQEARAKAKNLISNLTRIEKEYSDWEDRIVEIENAIKETEDITGLTKEEIIKPQTTMDELSDFLEE